VRCFFITLIIALALGLAFRGVKREIVHECDTIIVTVPVMQTDYLCFIGGDWVRCDPEKMASEELAKD